MLAGSGGIAVLLLRQHQPRVTVIFGAASLLIGVGVALVALMLPSAPLFFMGTAIAGAGFGAGFQGAVRNVISLAQPNERAGVLSVIFVVSYLAMGLPAVIAGTLIVEQGNVLATATEFGVGVMILAVLALLGAARVKAPRQTHRPPAGCARKASSCSEPPTSLPSTNTCGTVGGTGRGFHAHHAELIAQIDGIEGDAAVRQHLLRLRAVRASVPGQHQHRPHRFLVRAQVLQHRLGIRDFERVARHIGLDEHLLDAPSSMSME